jgi:Tfp pilus assembly protein PilV
MTVQRYRGTKRTGSTLIEVLFGVFIVTLCALIVAATTPTASMARFKAEQMNKAAGLAQKQLEAIKALGYVNATPANLASNGLIDSTSPIDTNTYSFTNSDSANLDNPSRILPSGTGTVKLETVSTNLVRVTVQVKWNERGTATRNVTIGTLIANL